jgi:hypothetical protein
MAPCFRYTIYDLRAHSNLHWFRKSKIVNRKSKNGFGRAVSRILSALLRAERIICLSSRYPESVSLSRNLERAAPGFPIWPCTRWGFPCRVACASRGALLPHLFTITPTPKCRGCLFSVALSVGNSLDFPPAYIPAARARVTRHRALWCSDFPLLTRAKSDSPPFQNH